MADIALKQTKLPTINELIDDEIVVNERNRSSNLTVLLNQNPPAQWIAKHPYIKKEVVIDGQKVKVPYEYLPINKVEYLLKKIFVHTKIEVLKYNMLLNSVSVHVRVHYIDPITKEWMYHDGLGAKEVQTAKDTGSLKLDMSNINKSAIEMALPIAEVTAIKDACEKFGKLFGSDLNRNAVVDYTSMLTSSIEETNDRKERERLVRFIDAATTKEQLEPVRATAEILGLDQMLNAKIFELDQLLKAKKQII